LGRALVGGLALIAIAVAALAVRPPELLRVASNYAAKVVCSSVFIANRDAGEVLRTDVQSIGNPLLKLLSVSVDRESGVVRAGLFGFLGHGLAQGRPGLGCTVLPDGRLPSSTRGGLGAGGGLVTAGGGLVTAGGSDTPPAAMAGALWPDGDEVSTDPRLDRVLGDAALAGSGMRAIVIVHGGRIVGERYAPGFTAATPLIGWSMTKSVTAGLIGLLVEDGRLTLARSAGWAPAAGDDRSRITIADLLGMSSGLQFDENYGAVSDVTRMLYLEPDMAAFARSKPLEHPPGTVWSYSTGTSLILARLVQETAGDGAGFVRRRLFEPLGMRSAIIEADAHGTLVGSSYMYAVPRDWARYAQFLLQEGVWHERSLLPPGYVRMMRTPVAASHGQYGHGQVWLSGPESATPGEDADKVYAMPADAFWMEGFDGQSATIIPSRDLVVLRMGLTPSRVYYLPQALVHAVLEAVT
jgi:CubicO group peptidase (beta-lactamase class C family)